MSEFSLHKFKSQYKAAAMTGNYKRTQSQVNTPSPCVSGVSYAVRPLPQCQLKYLMCCCEFHISHMMNHLLTVGDTSSFPPATSWFGFYIKFFQNFSDGL